MQKGVSLHLPFPFYFLLLISEKIIHYGRKTSLEKILYSIVINFHVFLEMWIIKFICLVFLIGLAGGGNKNKYFLRCFQSGFSERGIE